MLLLLSFLHSVSLLLLISVFFREIPWLCLMLLLTLPSVANLNNKTNYALYLNNNLGFIIKNHHGWIR
jgi:hypothetical protein